MNTQRENIDVFNQDALKTGGYLYTTNQRLSSFLANERLTRFTLESISIKDKKVIDVGCGDGTYSIELFDRGRPSEMVGIDGAANAISIANAKKGDRPILFETCDIYSMNYPQNSFDVAIVRGLLHHLSEPIAALRNILPIAAQTFIIEPNGYNFILKIIEKISIYHIRHKEKSYFPHSIGRWIRSIGGEIVKRKHVGLVPYFCPDWLANFLKIVQPAIEQTPVINYMLCGSCSFLIKKS